MYLLLLVLASLLIFVVGFAVVLSWMHRQNKAAAELSPQTPTSIHLREDPNPDWLSGSYPRQVAGWLEEFGFSPNRAWRIDQMPDVHLADWSDGDGIMAVLYHHQQAGYWVDLAIEYLDGRQINVTNCRFGRELETPPWATKEFHPGADLDELAGALRRHLDDQPRRVVEPDDFQAYFEMAYRMEMDWRAGRGGVSREEFDRVADGMDDQFEPKVRDAAFEEVKLEEMKALQNRLFEQFEAETPMNSDALEDLVDRGLVVFVGDDMDREALAAYLRTVLGVEGDWPVDAAQARTPSELFQVLDQARPPEGRARRIGRVSAPVRAEAYYFVDHEGGQDDGGWEDED
jgi:hypothetical protein